MSDSGSEDELEIRYGSGRIECVIKNSCKTIYINEMRNIQRHDPDFNQRIHCILCGIPSVASDSLAFSSIFDCKGSFSSVATILHTVSGVKITESKNPNENMMCQKCRGQIIALYSARKWLQELQKWVVNHLVSTVNKKRCAKVQVPESYKSIDFFAQQTDSSKTDDSADTNCKGEKVDADSKKDKDTGPLYLTIDANKDTQYVEDQRRALAKPKHVAPKKRYTKETKNCSCPPVAFVYLNGKHGMSLPIFPAANAKTGTKTIRPILPKLPRGTKVSAEVQTDNVRYLKKRRRSKNEDDSNGQSIEEAKLTTGRFTVASKPVGEDGIVPQTMSTKSVAPVPNEPSFGELEHQYQLSTTLNSKMEADVGSTITTSQKQQDYDDISSAISSWFSTPTTVCQENAIIPQYTESRPVVLHPCSLDTCSTEPFPTVTVAGVESSIPGYNAGSFCVTGPASVLPSNTIFQQSTDTHQFPPSHMVQGQQCMVTSSMPTSVSGAIISVPSQPECSQTKESTFPPSESMYPQHSFTTVSPATKRETCDISADNGISMLAEVSYKHYTNMETSKPDEAKKDKSINTVSYDHQQNPQTSRTSKEEISSKKLYEESANSKMFIRIPGNCKLCNHVFNTGDGHIVRKIQDHMFDHSSLNRNYSTGVMQYTCKGCDNKFSSLDLLKKHYKAKHMIGERFQCLVCNVAYMTFNVLSDHLNCHKGLKPYKCGVCGAEYAARTSLRTHLAATHKEKVSLACKICRTPSKHRQTGVKFTYYCRKCKKKSKT